MSFKKNDSTAVTAIVLGALGGLLVMTLFARTSPQTVRMMELTPAVPAAPEAPTPPPPPKAPVIADAVEELPPPPHADEDISAEPVFTPYTVPPRIQNVDDVMAKLEQSYPPLLKDAGIGGSVNVWFFIDEDGEVLNRRITQTSGHKALDGAALEVASVARFSAALNRDQPVPVWISIPITFQVR